MKEEVKPKKLQEATVKCWCVKTLQKFGVVVHSRDGEEWSVKHSFLCSEKYVDPSSEPFSTIGGFMVAESYNGCKRCGNKGLFKCEECSEINCERIGGLVPTKVTRCANCRKWVWLSGYAKSINISGD